MKITNTTPKTPLAVGAALIEPGETREISDWQELSANPIIAAWVKRGLLVVHGAVVAPTLAAKAITDDQNAEKDELIAALSLRGVKKDRRAGLDTLRQLVEEMQGADDEATDQDGNGAGLDQPEV